jgi:hypothetical protein
MCADFAAADAEGASSTSTAIPLLSATVCSEDQLGNSLAIEFAREDPKLEAWRGRNESLTAGKREFTAKLARTERRALGRIPMG